MQWFPEDSEHCTRKVMGMDAEQQSGDCFVLYSLCLILTYPGKPPRLDLTVLSYPETGQHQFLLYL